MQENKIPSCHYLSFQDRGWNDNRSVEAREWEGKRKEKEASETIWGCLGVMTLLRSFTFSFPILSLFALAAQPLFITFIITLLLLLYYY